MTTESSATGTQWIQWKVYLSGSGLETPSLEDVSIQFSP